jgi:hypothetical protein
LVCSVTAEMLEDLAAIAAIAGIELASIGSAGVDLRAIIGSLDT